MSLEVKMVRIKIDGKDYDVNTGKNLLETALSLGLDIPHFCFHPALGSVGACRLCAVKKFKDDNDTKGRIVMSCMEPVTEGLIVSIDDRDAKEFRAQVIEGLMTNHPHDCPVCDEGGECHLQDMTIMTGHNYRHYDFKKRTYNNQYLGPFISHEMNRCIQCYRCVRFYRDYAGGKDLNVFASHNHVYFGRRKDGVLESEFSGNLAEVCPTGVFTDKTLKKHYTRKWDLSNTPSICVHCSVGCNIIAGERYGTLRRVMSRYNGAVNGYFLCDRGRFGYEFVNDERRIRKVTARVSKESQPVEVTGDELTKLLSAAFDKGTKLAGIGSPRASAESNYALMSLVGRENFYNGVSANEYELTAVAVGLLRDSGLTVASLKDIEKCDAVLIIGEDITNTAPMMALALRQALRKESFGEAESKGIPLWNDTPLRELAQERKNPLFIATPYKDRLDGMAEDIFRASPDDIALFASAIASLLDEKAPKVTMSGSHQQLLVEKAAAALKNAKHPLIISGITNGSMDIVTAAGNVAMALKAANANAYLSLVLPESNSVGLALLPGKQLDEIIERSEKGETDTLVVLENDLCRRMSEDEVDRLFGNCRRVVVIDSLENSTTAKAGILFPAATFAEAEGTLVNNEGRAQRFFKAIPDSGNVKESWRWTGDFMKIRMGESIWQTFDDIVDAMIKEIPAYGRLKEYKPDAAFRMLNMKIPRQTMRYSGRTAMNAHINVSEGRSAQDNDSPLAFSMEGVHEDPPSSLVPYYWTPGWNSVQAMNSYMNEPSGSLLGGDPGIRLFEAALERSPQYYSVKSILTDKSSDEIIIVPVFSIFGSEELSCISPAVAGLCEEQLLSLNAKEAEKRGIRNNSFVTVKVNRYELKVKAEVHEKTPDGIALLSGYWKTKKYICIPALGKLTII